MHVSPIPPCQPQLLIKCLCQGRFTYKNDLTFRKMLVTITGLSSAWNFYDMLLCTLYCIWSREQPDRVLQKPVAGSLSGPENWPLGLPCLPMVKIPSSNGSQSVYLTFRENNEWGERDWDSPSHAPMSLATVFTGQFFIHLSVSKLISATVLRKNRCSQCCWQLKLKWHLHCSG